jgi:quercetin dioxygenase-like cupin family protein
MQAVYEGELSSTLKGRAEPMRLTPGEWILAPANTFHLIQVHGRQSAIRIATTFTGEYRRHERTDAPPVPPYASEAASSN